ncbi:MAG: outer membrane protein assembly factor BamD [Cytophagaceae bacterium]|jgi:outer membrane protein assembly factor BamD|nr:outer membrane protein assembly factor BamD [Cytophagaceae bacterium]
MFKKYLIYCFSLLLLASCNQFGKFQRSASPEEKLTKAIEYFNKKDYYKAGVLLEEITPILKGKQGAEEASYYFAYNYYRQKQYVMSAYYFKDFYLTYPRSTRVEETMFMHAKSLYFNSPEYNLDQEYTYNALKAITTFADRYPKSQFMEECTKMADELNAKLITKAYQSAYLYYKTQNYKSATIALTNFLKDYPTSDYTESALYYRIAAQLKLAKNSIGGEKQIERFYEVIDYYQQYVDRFPKGNFAKEALESYDYAVEQLNNLKK